VQECGNVQSSLRILRRLNQPLTSGYKVSAVAGINRMIIVAALLRPMAVADGGGDCLLDEAWIVVAVLGQGHVSVSFARGGGRKVPQRREVQLVVKDMRPKVYTEARQVHGYLGGIEYVVVKPFVALLRLSEDIISCC
jgi:hypothetical protein